MDVLSGLAIGAVLSLLLTVVMTYLTYGRGKPGVRLIEAAFPVHGRSCPICEYHLLEKNGRLVCFACLLSFPKRC